jgi:hypothetical protein
MRKFEALMEIKKLGLDVGEVMEFEYSKRKKMYEYARHLFSKYGGLIIRTDFPKDVQDKKAIGLPFMSPCNDFKKFEEFVGRYKEKYTYLLFQMCDYSKVILSAYVYLDEFKNLLGEINDVDKINMRDAMAIGKNLKPICIGPGGSYDERLNKVRGDLIRAGIPPFKIIELSVFNVNGKPVPLYKQYREGGF